MSTILAATGLALFVPIVAWSLWLTRRAQRHVAELEQAYRRLEQETKERERAQLQLRVSEEQLRQALKLEALGRLAGGVAHDFNNLLTAINGYVEFLQMDLDPQDPAREHVSEIRKAATRATRLTGQLLAFSRRQVRQPKAIDLNALVADLEKILRRVVGEDVQLVTQFGDTGGSVHADPSQLEQVLMNLVVNAGDAMPHGGRLVISTGALSLLEDASGAPGGGPQRAGRYVVLSVQDEGLGMDEATKRRVFEPFFTTKAPGRGTGLGLATVATIVEQSGGAIALDSRLGEGTTFTVYFPLHTDAAEVFYSGTFAPPPPRGTETILLAEDDDAVRLLGRQILERHGYRVLEAKDGRRALEVAGSHPGRIDLLVTDVVMPELGGKALAERLRAMPSRRDIDVLFMSGYTDGEISRRGELDADVAFLAKPLTSRSLLGKVREVLDRPAIVAP